MLHLLAQSLPDIDPTKLGRRWCDALHSVASQPPNEAFWNWVAGLGYVEAAVSIAIGLVYLLYGFKVFKILVIVNAAALGAWVGYLATQQWQIPWWTPPVAGLALGLLAWPLMRYAVCVMGALAGALLGTFIAKAIGLSDQAVLAGAIIGLATLGLLAFVIFRIIVTGFTSLQGSLLATAGVVAVAARALHLSDPIRQGLADRPYMLPILIFVPAAAGFVYQLARKDGDKK